MTEPELTIELQNGRQIVRFRGDVVIATLGRVQRALAPVSVHGQAVFDLADVAALDTAGAWLIADFEKRAKAEGGRIVTRGASALQDELLETVRRSLPQEAVKPRAHPGFLDWVAALGQQTLAAGRTFLSILGFFGMFLARFGALFVRPRRLRFTSLVHHMQEVGLNAIPIVSLMSFLIGVVLAFQGAAQLRQFGAEVFVVDLIGISVLRELGILLTAIIVAGRSGAAFTAAIGSMKMREEIDAMNTLGLDPLEVLILPRVLALVIVLPILGFIANMMGLLGGALMSWIELGVSPGMFMVRLGESIGVWHYGVGLIKAPFFAVIIGIIGCYQGMMVEGNAESLGRLTSKSVVMSIFMVIVVDAIFSIFFAIVEV